MKVEDHETGVITRTRLSKSSYKLTKNQDNGYDILFCGFIISDPTLL